MFRDTQASHEIYVDRVLLSPWFSHFHGMKMSPDWYFNRVVIYEMQGMESDFVAKSWIENQQLHVWRDCSFIILPYSSPEYLPEAFD